MNTEYLQHDLKQSFVLIVTQERRLFAGVLGGIILYALWVGATAAALDQFAEVAAVSTTLDPWTSDTTGLAAVGAILWILLPAVGAAYGVNRAVTTTHGYLAKPYRLRHPATLLVAPLVIVVFGLGAFVLSDGHRSGMLIVLVGSVFFHIRVLPYAYRVFSLSAPRLVSASLVLTGMGVSTALLVEGVLAAGQSEAVDAVGDGLAGVFGIDALAQIGGTTTVAGRPMPLLLGVAAATPLALGGLYLVVQTILGALNRMQSPTVARSEIRTGQRYPEFAKPTVAPSERTRVTTPTPATTTQKAESIEPPAQESKTPTAEQTAETLETRDNDTAAAENEDEGADTGEEESETDPVEDEEPVDDVSHTKIFRPPGDEET